MSNSNLFFNWGQNLELDYGDDNLVMGSESFIEVKIIVEYYVELQLM